MDRLIITMSLLRMVDEEVDISVRMIVDVENLSEEQGGRDGQFSKAACVKVGSAR